MGIYSYVMYVGLRHFFKISTCDLVFSVSQVAGKRLCLLLILCQLLRSTGEQKIIHYPPQSMSRSKLTQTRNTCTYMSCCSFKVSLCFFMISCSSHNLAFSCFNVVCSLCMFSNLSTCVIINVSGSTFCYYCQFICKKMTSAYLADCSLYCSASSSNSSAIVSSLNNLHGTIQNKDNLNNSILIYDCYIGIIILPLTLMFTFSQLLL